MSRLHVICLSLLLLTFTAPAAALSGTLANADRALLDNRFADAEAAYAEAAPDAADAQERAHAFRGLAATLLARDQGLSAVTVCLQAILADPGHPGNIGLAKAMEQQIQLEGVPEHWDETYTEVVAAAARYPMLSEYLLDPELWVLRSRGEFEAAWKLKEGYADIDEFLIAGPFSNTGGSGIYEPYPPEFAIEEDATYYDRLGRPFGWELERFPKSRRVDFDLIFDNEPDAVGYALTHVHADSEMQVVASVFGSDAFRMWVNGEPVLRERTVRLPSLSLYEVPATLKAGWNRILLKAASETDPLRFSLSLCDREGKGLHLETSVDPDVYDGNERPGGPVPDSMPTYTFESLPEVHWLRDWRDYTKNAPLADCYFYLTFLDFQGFEVELDRALSEFYTRYPGSAIIAGERADLLSQTNRGGEASALLRRTAANAPEYAYGATSAVLESIQQGEMDDAWEIVLKGLEKNPESLTLLTAKITTAMARGEMAGGLAELERMFDEAPQSYVVRMGYLTMLDVVGDEVKYHAALEQAVQHKADDRAALRALAAVALGDGEYDKALSYLDRILETGERFDVVSMSRGSVLEKAGRPEEALEAFLTGLERCPRSASLLESVGRVLNNIGENKRAAEYFEKCAERDVRAFPKRHLVRTLLGEPPLDDYFPDVDIESLNSEDISWAGDGKEAITLLDMQHVVVHKNGSYELKRHIATKVLNRAGADYYSEAGVPYFRDSIDGEIEIARTVKPDGREVEADRGFMQVSFADVEPGDVVELRYTSTFVPTVGLPGEFWYRHYFQNRIPVLESRLALLVPKDMDYEVMGHEMDAEPVTTDHGKWRLDVWQAERMEALPMESRMPPLSEMCAWIDVSTMKDWTEVAAWYDRTTLGRLQPGREVLALATKLTEGAADDSSKIHAVANYVRQNIQYEDVGFNQSGYIPRPVDEVLRTKLGDCKDQSVLIVSLLREAAVDAGLVLVNSRDYMTVPTLPSPGFTHCIARAVASDGREYWIDPTSETMSFPNVPVELEGARALPIESEATVFLPIDMDGVNANGSDSVLRVVVDGDGGYSATGTCRYRGEDAMTQRYIALHYADQLEEATRDVIASEHPAAVVDTATLSGADDLDAAMVLDYSFRRAGAVSKAGNLSILGVPWTIGRVPHALVSLEERSTPLVLDSWRGHYTEDVELVLPEGYTLQSDLPLVDISTDVASFSITGEQREDGSIVLRKDLMIDALRIEPEDYPEFRSFLEAAWKAEGSQLVFERA